MYIIVNTYPICDSQVPLRSVTKIAPTENNVFICEQTTSSVWFSCRRKSYLVESEQSLSYTVKGLNPGVISKVG